jgi:hypothetical protein
MYTKIGMLIIYGLPSGKLIRRISFTVESLFVNYLTGGVIVIEHEIRYAESARRKDGRRDHAVGLTGAGTEEVADEF